MKSRLHSDDVESVREDDDWLIWQLADSAFPAGGFAHSAGLEAAWQHGEVRSRSELAAILETSLRQLGHASLPFFNAAHDEPGELGALDQDCDAFLTNHVANRASRLQGRAFLASAERIFPGRQIKPPNFGHFAPIFGAAMRSLGLQRIRAARLFFFLHLRGLVAAAIRLGIIGPMEGQALQHRLSPVAEEILTQCNTTRAADATQTSPLMEIWQESQDRLYSRLFQS